MKTFELTLRTPEGVFYCGETSLLSVRQNEGVLQILAGHEDAVAELVASCCSFKDELGEQKEFSTSSGLLSVKGGNVLLLSLKIVWGKLDFSEEDSQIESFDNADKRRRHAREEYTRSKMQLAKTLWKKNNKGNM